MAKKIIKSKDIAGLAEYIASDECKNIVLMVRVSTSAGIPDFRLKLPYPEAVFEISFFRRNPEPFYTLAHELYPGKFRPTITHSFIRLLAKHALLHMCFTQNIDTLERRAGVPSDKIIEAHGSFAAQRCIDCRRPYDDAKMKAKILAKATPVCGACGGLVKPDIVFFGEALPDEFIRAIPCVAQADLLIIMGTSMTVHPFAGLAERTGPACPRVLVNLDRVGGIGRRPNDVVLLGKCDDKVRELCRALGWEDELLALWAQTEIKAAPAPDEPEAEAEAEVAGPAMDEPTAEDLVGAITDAIERQLNLEEAEPVKEDAVPPAAPADSGSVKADAKAHSHSSPQAKAKVTDTVKATDTEQDDDGASANSDPKPGKL
ncbi:Sir2 family histone deacetylase Hst2 [Mycena pura]|uniref:Sir2 family histone deacetylase Hst2 n=1 Tax=Mycena pura TaxID=153505 RepID=A0AAD6VJG4_9AGAR|nr:Sir2 family histone deacetylase Hst2 [Mycena pura]